MALTGAVTALARKCSSTATVSRTNGTTPTRPRRSQAKAREISGLPKIPVIVFPDGSFLSEPSNPQLEERLEANDLI